jgi:4-diphosphocytidyl-2-C-methyl-D-erythritol kinase
MLTFPNAKINIGLDVVRKRNDGYHDIKSIFYPVKTYYDALEIFPSEKLKLTLCGINIPVIFGENLCLQAFDLIKKEFDIPPVEIRLLKKIPIGSGLGGGSSDASFTLKMLNSIFNLGLTAKELTKLSEKIGSDCPFFIENTAKFITGRGDILEEIEINLSGYHITIITPEFKISTREAYSKIKPQKHDVDLNELIKLPVDQWKNWIVNDFEKIVFDEFPFTERIKSSLYEFGVDYASLSGSGSSLYALSKTKLEIQQDFFPKCLIWQGVL